MKRILSVSLALLLCCLAVLPALLSASADETKSTVGELSGEVSRESHEILLDDGTPTGVIWTQVALEGFYGSKVVNVAEFSLANTHLSLEVINSGKANTIVAANTTVKGIEAYSERNPGKTVLAAVNGDLWMTAVHSGSEVTTKVLKVTRGALITDGEIWASQQIDMENYAATNAEKGTPAGDKAAFGVTDQNQPLVGSPDIRISIAVNGKTIAADGLNRLPCWNSLIVYNHRVNSSNYALNDAYEVEIQVEDQAAFRAGGTLTGKVVAVYPANSATRPSLSDPKTVVLTARGNKLNTLKDNFSVGDTVTLSTTLTDRWGHTELWQHVQEAIGGHMQVLVDGRQGVANGSTAEYPSTLIGYRDDGSVMLATVSSSKKQTYAGLRFNQAYQFCKELGYNSVFYLDGGGSTTFVSLEDGTYTVRNNCSDKSDDGNGAPRIVINSVGVVWNPEPVCERQGSLNYIDIPVDLSQIPPTYMDGALLADVVGGPNAVSISYDENEKALAMTTTATTGDPYATLSFKELSTVDADVYPYLVFKVKTDNKSTTNFKLYYAAGSVTGPTEACTKSFQVKPGEEWQYIVVDMSQASKWSGTINNIRLDIFDSVNTPAGVTMYIGAIVLCEYLEDAQNVENGWTPEGAVVDYLAYKESLRPVVTEPPTEEPTEPPTEPPTEAPTEEPTEAPTEVLTDAPTEAPTEKPTEAPTEAPTDVLTQADTTAEEDTEPAETTGCQSALAVTGVVGLLALAVVAVKKRK